MKPIAIFYHVFNCFNCCELYSEQMQKVIRSGLLQASDVMYINVTGDKQIPLYGQRKVKYTFQDDNLFEYSTLKMLKNYANTHNCYILYFHTKGISRQEPQLIENITAWRKFMEYFNIENYADCIRMLDDGYDACGVNWWKDHKHPHFSGNFWWATSDYIKKLPNPLLVTNVMVRTVHEFWIGLKKPKVYSFCNNAKAFYTSLITEKDYVKT